MTDDRPNDPAAAAAAWYARTRAEDAGVEDVAALDRWMRQDAANAVAWGRVEGVDAMLRGVADDPAIAALRAEALAPARRATPWRHYAAAAAMVAGVGVATMLAVRPIPASKVPSAIRYASGTGEVRPVGLADGSTMTLDATSTAEVAPFGAERRVSLTGGRALFAVAKDPAHPFTVTAADLAVTALGTRFSVERRDGSTEVALVEGSVRVTTPLGTRTLVPGQVLTLAGDRLRLATGAADGWAEGRLDFSATPLSDVVATLARYEPTRIVIRDRPLAAHPFSGTLKTHGGAEALVAALNAYGVARVAKRDGDTIELVAP